jgi:hypothetical protein
VNHDTISLPFLTTTTHPPPKKASTITVRPIICIRLLCSKSSATRAIVGSEWQLSWRIREGDSVPREARLMLKIVSFSRGGGEEAWTADAQDQFLRVLC